MAYTRKTGGTHEFHYKKADLKRIGSKDTSSSRDFKAALREHYEKRRIKSKKNIFILVAFFVIIVIALCIRYII
ncbi:hypothetical protein COV93_08455 [Candidatus Woesearchaeota archaeon CG11_big_fil_rev_8_21_14_0_20_43_8]|nr:MAG: hypothetical protein COV93_08455 [Candidatus Woesearchaeota archaeon CG11_big_fil_rev_8_21_14_0_20_43_8]PIO05175.1 MAG: hypothetical protein COT47_05895 [Candidatus Woesearchaeota archaeon CG08_land_8_20_14_0_20_43_7]